MQARRIDPRTGELFNTEVNAPEYESVRLRMQRLPQDAEDLVRKRYSDWSENVIMLEDRFRACMALVPTDRLPDQVFDALKQIVDPDF